jgi:endoglucanase
MTRILSPGIAALLLLLSAPTYSPAAQTVHSPKASEGTTPAIDPRLPLQLRTVGHQIINSGGKPVILAGVNCASLEWSSDGQGHILQSVQTAIRDWHVNVIRLPLSQDRWFGKGPEQKDGGIKYRGLVRGVVDTCATQKCYIILDLHWSNCGQWGANIGQHSMPDTNSIAFWQDVATRYKNHPSVIFDLYNEPHDVSWDVWLNGGVITDRPNRRNTNAITYEAVGMQPLLDAIRSTGARNVVLVGGLDWAYDFSGILDGHELKDPRGNGVVYANHAYNNKGDSAAVWIEKMERASQTLPILIGEFGGSGGPSRRTWGRRQPDPSGDDWLLHMMQGIVDHGWSYTAWDFHPSAGPTLISGWSYEPTPDFGVYVKLMLAGEYPRYTPPEAAPKENSPSQTPASK